jgi:ABC transporter substrate binding protein
MKNPVHESCPLPCLLPCPRPHPCVRAPLIPPALQAVRAGSRTAQCSWVYPTDNTCVPRCPPPSSKLERSKSRAARGDWPWQHNAAHDVTATASAIGLQISQVANASSSREINAAFDAFARDRPDLLFVGLDIYSNGRRAQLVTLAARHAVPAIFSNRDFTEIGGLMSYGTNIADAYRQVGVYAGRILKGAKPADLPVVQAVKFELVINVSTARMLGLSVPPSLLAVADEVIE